MMQLCLVKSTTPCPLLTPNHNKTITVSNCTLQGDIVLTMNDTVNMVTFYNVEIMNGTLSLTSLLKVVLVNVTVSTGVQQSQSSVVSIIDCAQVILVGCIDIIGTMIPQGSEIQRGGCLHVRNSVVSGDDLVLQYCRAQEGGGLYQDGGGEIVLHSLTMIECVAESNGGGIYQRGTATLTTPSLLIRNSGANNGGSIYQEVNTTMNVTSTT
eukprot:PhF_6_TR37098/c0_g2_i10/m.54468